jgi:hypothetical protein
MDSEIRAGRCAAGLLIAILSSVGFTQTQTTEVADAKLARLAIETARAGTITPIPLDSSAGPSHGVIYDRFLLGVISARAALAAGRTPFSAGAGAGPSFVPDTMAVVAYPRPCSGRLSPAQAVRVTARIPVPSATPGEPPTTRSDPAPVVATGAAAKTVLPGVTVPASALVVVFESRYLVNASVSIDYSEPLCPGTLKTIDLVIEGTPSRVLKTVTTADMPADLTNLASPAPVQVHGVIDRDGSFKFPSVLKGPPELEAASAEIMKQWRFEPERTNGVATPRQIQVPITFTAKDRPATPISPAPVGPPANPPPSRTPAPGDTTVALTLTDDQPGLTSATSKCPVSDDDTYARSAANAVRIGGGADAVGRAERYMTALRGPGGFGLKYRRTGAMLAPDQKTIVDVFEVSYAGLVQPIRLYFDRTNTDVPKAPKAWACFQEIKKDP